MNRPAKGGAGTRGSGDAKGEAGDAGRLTLKSVSCPYRCPADTLPRRLLPLPGFPRTRRAECSDRGAGQPHIQVRPAREAARAGLFLEVDHRGDDASMKYGPLCQ